MKKLKINLALLALVAGVSAAYATTAINRPAITYGFDQASGTWVLPQPGARCTPNPTPPCEAQFNGDPNNGGIMVPGSETKGNFVQ